MVKQNVVIFFTDDQRFDTIHALGNNEIKTPNIDQLASEGVCFCQAHIPGGTVGAVCMPSRAMLNTGRTLFHLEDCGRVIPESDALMGETFKKAGYECFGVGKWHNGRRAFSRSFTNGDEIFFGGMNDHWNVPVYHYDPSGKYETTMNITPNFNLHNKVTKRPGDHVNSGKHSSEVFSNAALNLLKSRNREKPFFMYLAFMAPHDPRTMPEQFRQMYTPEDISLPENFMSRHPFNYGVENIRDELLTDYPRNEYEVRKHIAEYYGMISHLDYELGRVVSYLKETGDYENTIIVFAGDNGLALGQHGLFGKQSCYEHSIRVPLIIKGNGIPKGVKTNQFAYLLDIFPTLCEMTGNEIPKSVEGRSLLPIIYDDKCVRKDLYLAYGSLVRGIKNQNYKLIEYRKEGVCRTQLFDLKNDPKEMHNIADRADMGEIVSEMRSKLFTYANEWGDIESKEGKEFWKFF